MKFRKDYLEHFSIQANQLKSIGMKQNFPTKSGYTNS